MKSKRNYVIILFLSILILDQGTKLAADLWIPMNTSRPVIEDFFNLTHIRNTGAAFGILAGSHKAFRLTFLILFSLLAIGFIVRLLWRLPNNEVMLITALTFILGGAVGNLMDRIFYGEVIDFLDFYWSDFHWPAFNFADSFITTGVLLSFWHLFRSKDQEPLFF